MTKNVPRHGIQLSVSNCVFDALAMGTGGGAFQRSRPCGQNGCHKLHHVLLHSNDNRQIEAKSRRCLSNPEASHIDTNSLSIHQRTSGTEGNNVPQE